MHTDDEVEIMTEDDEERFGQSLQKALVSNNPNPGRKGCPDQKLIRDLAFHKNLGNSLLFEQITAHMAECSECVRDALRYVDEYQKKKRKSGKAT